MHTEHQHQQAEDRREAAASHHQAAEDRRNVMEDMRQVAEEMRDTREQMRVEEGKEQHTSLERRMALIEEHLRRLDERCTELEQHLLQHVETLHHASRIQEEKNKEHIDHARQTVESSKQKIKDTGKLIERAQGQTRRFEE